MKIIILLALFAFIAGCSVEGQRCWDWRIKPGCDSLVAAYVQNALSTMQITSRYENEDWDDFAHQVQQDAIKIYGYKAEGIRHGDADEWNCECFDDMKLNARAKVQHATQGLVVQPVSQASPKLPE